jgi:hypothetical protein
MKKTQQKTQATFTLFSQEWQIRTGNDQELPEHLGLCLPDERKILLHEQQDQMSKKHTLLHELLHAVEQKLSLGMTEKQVDLMALGLLDLMRNNPELLAVFDDRELKV